MGINTCMGWECRPICNAGIMQLANRTAIAFRGCQYILDIHVISVFLWAKHEFKAQASPSNQSSQIIVARPQEHGSCLATARGRGLVPTEACKRSRPLQGTCLTSAITAGFASGGVHEAWRASTTYRGRYNSASTTRGGNDVRHRKQINISIVTANFDATDQNHGLKAWK